MYFQDEGTQREEVIRVSEIYYKDFLQRCNDYEISEIDLDFLKEDPSEAESSAPSRPPDLAKMNSERDAKLKRYREQKEMEARLEELQGILDKQNSDEDLVREFYLKTIKRFINVCIDECNSFKMEKQILQHMKMVKAGKAPAVEKQPAKRRPLKPIIITKDAMQKEVFGLGYKNVPVLSIEEFYEQRVRDGWFPDPNQRAAAAPSSLQGRTQVDMQEVEEQEEAEKEQKEERDDEEELAKKRAWDEYKDDHRRGEGNRHNRAWWMK